MFVQLAFGSILNDQEDSLTIVEMAVEFQDIRVTEIALDFDLPSRLLLDLSLLKLALVQDLEGADKARDSFTSKIDPSKLPLTQGFPDFEHP